MIKNYAKSFISFLSIVFVSLILNAQEDMIVVPSCKADFSFELYPPVNVSPFSYTFKNLSTGGSALSYFWDFGDGKTSTEANPTHYYAFYAKDGQLFMQVGTPKVCLTVSDPFGCMDIICKEIPETLDSNVVIPSCEAKIYAYESKDSMVSIPELKKFDLEAVSNPEGVSWIWYYNDSAFSTQQKTSFWFPMVWNEKYQQYGNEVCVKVITIDGCETTACQFVPWNNNNTNYCKSTYTYARVDSGANRNLVKVQFNGSSENNIEKWHWDFGDTTTSDQQSPTHEFIIPDIKCFMAKCLVDFKVCLTTTTDNGCEYTYCEYITPSTLANASCAAKFSYSLLESYPPVYAFKNESTVYDSAVYYWDFGDGTYSYEKNPSHTFSNYSMKNIDLMERMVNQWVYNVCLTVASPEGCNNVYCKDIYVTPDTFYNICKNRIKLSTSAVLGSNACDGSASALLVDKMGNPVEAAAYFWSTGATSSSISNLCTNTMYSLSITDASGCTVVNSFAISDYTETDPWSPPTYWSYEKYDSTYIFKSLVNNPSYYSEWHFSDGSTQEGNIIYNNVEDSKWVDLVITDSLGNQVYTKRISLGNEATELGSVDNFDLKIYPVPATDKIHIESNGLKNAKIEIIDLMGKVVLKDVLTDKISTFDVTRLSRGTYICRFKTEDGRVKSSKFIK